MDLTLRQLRTLREVATRGTLAAAATSLGYTASAISQQLAALERATGVPVIERVGRGVRLTDVGRELVHHAEAVIATVDEAEAAIERVATAPRGEVHLAVFGSFAAALLPDVERRIRTEHPEVVVRSSELDPDDALGEVVAGSIDLALVLDYPHAPSPRPRGVEWRVLRREPFRLAVPADDELTSVVDLATMAERAFITGAVDTSCGRCTHGACRDAGFEPDVRHEIDSLPATLRLVAAGAGVALLPDLALVDAPPGVRLLDLEVPLHRTIELAVRPATLGRPSVTAVLDAVVGAVGCIPEDPPFVAAAS